GTDMPSQSLLLQSLCAAIGCMLMATCVHGATYFVAPSGADANPGTLEKPFRTIQRAADVMKPGDTCFARAGVYRETVRPATSGEQGKPITFAAYEDEEVVISGADPITGWRPADGRIYRAATDWTFNQLFVDGQMMNLARWPDAPLDPMRPTWAVAAEGSAPNLIIDPHLPTRDLGGATIHILPGAHWVSWTRPVLEYDPSAHALKFESSWGQDWAYVVKDGSRYYLMGAHALLDAPGEWYVDEQRQTVSLWAPEGDDPARHRVEAKRRDLAFDLSERQYIHVKGFRIFASTISMAGAGHCVARNCHVRYASHFMDCGGWGTGASTGVLISGDHNQFRDSSVVYSAGNGVTLEGERNVVRNCLIRGCDYMAGDCGAIWAGGTRNAIVRNTLCETGRTVLVHRTLKTGVIAYNDMYHAGLMTSDLGITYCYDTDGAGTVIAYNRVHHNRAESCGVGIYIDNGSSNFIIHHNVSWGNQDSGIRLNTPSHHNLVYYNTIHDNANSLGYWGPNDNRDQAGCRAVNNICTNDVITGDGIEINHNFAGKEPGFVGASEADFRLREDSPCVDAGVVIPGITSRCVGAAPDLGAYELGLRPWTAGHNWGEPPVF
ncbi:MAG: right-handed parallel beta-helix repeat-containing protein, partial [Armatimonadota bacterium]